MWASRRESRVPDLAGAKGESHTIHQPFLFAELSVPDISVDGTRTHRHRVERGRRRERDHGELLRMLLEGFGQDLSLRPSVLSIHQRQASRVMLTWTRHAFMRVEPRLAQTRPWLRSPMFYAAKVDIDHFLNSRGKP